MPTVRKTTLLAVTCQMCDGPLMWIKFDDGTSKLKCQDCRWFYYIGAQ